MNRVLVIGGSGQLGTEIRRRWTDYDVTAPAHADLDLENTDALAAAIDRVVRDDRLREVLAGAAAERVEAFALPRVQEGFVAALGAACAA